MANAFDMHCPECGDPWQIDITATLQVRVTKEGTDADASEDGSHVWDGDSPCRCISCGWEGTADDAENGFDFDEKQSELRAQFACMIADAKGSGSWPYSDDDEIALNEEFNNWTDALCKSGEISEYVYNSVTRTDD